MSNPPEAAQVNLPWAQTIWQEGNRAESPRIRARGALPALQLDAQDRPAPNTQALISLAVILDVLATQTRRVPADRLILARLAEVALAAGSLGDVVAPGWSALLTYAESAAGHERARLSQALAAHAHAAGAARSTPETVGAATRRLERAAELVVREVCLLLAAKDAMASKQA